MPQVKSISKTEITFTLDQDDLNEGIVAQLNKEQFEDPIAKALKKIGKYRKVFVGWVSASGYKGPVRHEFQIINYKEVTEFLKRYDSGKEIYPITITMFFEREVNITAKSTKSKKPKSYEHAYLGSDGKVVP